MSQPISPQPSGAETDDLSTHVVRKTAAGNRGPLAILQKTIAWIYDFLAEDLTLLVGAALAIVVAVLAVHVSKNVAGYVLFVAVVLVIAASLWRTVSAGKT